MKARQQINLARLILLAILSALTLISCSKQSWYQGMQASHEAQCMKEPASQYEECMKQSDDSYIEYEKKRGDLNEYPDAKAR